MRGGHGCNRAMTCRERARHEGARVGDEREDNLARRLRTPTRPQDDREVLLQGRLTCGGGRGGGSGSRGGGRGRRRGGGRGGGSRGRGAARRGSEIRKGSHTARVLNHHQDWLAHLWQRRSGGRWRANVSGRGRWTDRPTLKAGETRGPTCSCVRKAMSGMLDAGMIHAAFPPRSTAVFPSPHSQHQGS